MSRPVVLVTGASRGLGAAIAEWLGKAGAAVALLARSQDALEQVAGRVRNLGGEAFCRPVDLADLEDTRRAAQEVLAHYSCLDGLVNNAGVVSPVGPLARVSAREWNQAVHINLTAPAMLMQVCIPPLRASRGRIVNVSTGAAQRPVPSWSAYCATKAALLLLTTTVAAEEPDIVCTSLRPGVVDTDMQRLIREVGGEHMPAELAAYFRGLKEKGELEPPHVPGRVGAWLALKAPRELSGQLVDYQDPQLTAAARSFLGEALPA